MIFINTFFNFVLLSKCRASPVRGDSPPSPSRLLFIYYYYYYYYYHYYYYYSHDQIIIITMSNISCESRSVSCGLTSLCDASSNSNKTQSNTQNRSRIDRNITRSLVITTSITAAAATTIIMLLIAALSSCSLSRLYPTRLYDTTCPLTLLAPLPRLSLFLSSPLFAVPPAPSPGTYSCPRWDPGSAEARVKLWSNGSSCGQTGQAVVKRINLLSDCGQTGQI
jgi:hypothetical protein